MKTLLLIAMTTFLSISSYAQANELNCTEQAFTLKLNLPAGGHNSSSQIGRFDASQIAPGFRLPGPNSGKQNQAYNMLPIGIDKRPDPHTTYSSADTIMFKKMTFLHPKINNVTGKFTYTAYDHFKLLSMPVLNALTPLLN
ncbi:hypothetical protein DIU31_016690 [Mucilaginibacter rubeus]|uniref:Uncharacterized protein n=1 Tax=Mucilaginibacter rubeus TaxID=2027860 RepID=A0AAE6JGL3_9SPHI|nr:MULTISPECIES: hypothetical protein [Mucilaginibacter]QEM05071.1 hypothetical protein DIU31_016690 [Mucilaginibacter rubeus]QEM17664.1 hypothetical protein DIU38_016860 [Mucilaginibacter gossypii]QTE45811.1 hypothetical protein J3L19_10825 [Mucilaginibacter rubeus]QTE52408.1 hypothetical protein J3L21_10800 [Mucilaginibacter rubeus]QTE57497.1 hypothetical protein J3L23_02475 [Mucilaginibacter rubeus]